MSEPYAYLDVAGKTDIGRVRAQNEDSIGMSRAHGWCCVADGMGGEQAGDIASNLTVNLIEEELTHYPDANGVDNLHTKRQLLEHALLKANARIRSYVREQRLNQSGSTVAAIAFDYEQPEKALIAHAGDSRVYRFRSNTLKQLTVDHSVAAAAGLKDEAEIPLLFRGVITKAVGIEKTLEVDFDFVDVKAGDLFLLCSDGLTGSVDDSNLATLLTDIDLNDLPAATRVLIDAANEGGGKDNISAVLVHVSTLPSPRHTDSLRSIQITNDQELKSIRESINPHKPAMDEETDSNSFDLSDATANSETLNSITDSIDAIPSDSTNLLDSESPSSTTIEFSTEDLAPLPPDTVDDETDTQSESDSVDSATLDAGNTEINNSNRQTAIFSGIALLLLAIIGLSTKELITKDRDPSAMENNNQAEQSPIKAPLLEPKMPDAEKQQPGNTPVEAPAASVEFLRPAVNVAPPLTSDPPPEPNPQPTPMNEQVLHAAQIDSLRQHLDAAWEYGAWGALNKFTNDTRLTRLEVEANVEEFALTQKWQEIWGVLEASPEKAILVYDTIEVHVRSLEEVGATWSQHPLTVDGLSTNKATRANQVCRAIHILRQDGYHQIELLSNVLRSCLHLFTENRESLLPYLESFYDSTGSLGNLNAYRKTVRQAQMANKGLADLKRIIQQSPEAFLNPSSTPDFSAPQFMETTRDLLSKFNELSDRTQFDQVASVFERQLKGTRLDSPTKRTGELLLKAVYDTYDALSLYRINYPPKFGNEKKWISEDQASIHVNHFHAVRDFIRWNDGLSHPDKNQPDR